MARLLAEQDGRRGCPRACAQGAAGQQAFGGGAVETKQGRILAVEEIWDGFGDVESRVHSVDAKGRCGEDDEAWWLGEGVVGCRTRNCTHGRC